MTIPHDGNQLDAVHAWMRELARAPLDGPPMPDPSFLWWKAQMLRRWDAERHATAPIDLGERVQVGVGCAGVAALVAWMWRAAPFSLSAAMMTLITVTIAVVAAAAALTAWSVGPRE